MKRLNTISQEYLKLKEEATNKLNQVSSNKDVSVLEDSKFVKYKDLENKAEAKTNEFVNVANKYAKDNAISQRDLIIKISEEILSNQQSNINIFLLIRLMWDSDLGEEKYCLKSIENLLNKLLSPIKIDHKEAYYIESLIDIWNHDSDQLIPIKLLESIILKEHQGTYSYSAFIKASSYLKNHPEKEVQEVIRKVKQTQRYKEDDYYREWI